MLLLKLILLGKLVLGQDSSQLSGNIIVERNDIRETSLMSLYKFFDATSTYFEVADNPKWIALTTKFQSERDHSKEHNITSKLDHFAVKEFEMHLKEIHPNVTIPYWDYTSFYKTPHLDPVFFNTMFGSKLSVTGGCLQDGNFVKYKGKNSYCLKRNPITPTTSNSSDPLLPAPEEVDNFLQAPDESEAFKVLSQLTQKVYKFLGGEFNTKSPYRDPLFFSIQSFHLYLIYQWDEKHQGMLTEKDEKYKQDQIAYTLPGSDTSSSQPNSSSSLRQNPRDTTSAQKNVLESTSAQENARKSTSARENARESASAQENARESASAQENARESTSAQENARESTSDQENARESTSDQERAPGAASSPARENPSDAASPPVQERAPRAASPSTRENPSTAANAL